MTRKKNLAGGKLVMATIVATGMATAPAAFTSGFILQSNTAAAQTDGSAATGVQAGDEGFAAERAERRADGTAVDSHESVYEILGTTRDEAEAADTHTSATAQSGRLAAYQTEVERGNLDAAADNLAAIAERPITEKMVTEVNTELGVETHLTAEQLADAAANKQE